MTVTNIDAVFERSKQGLIMLFSNFERVDGSIKRYRESNYEFIDRSADPDVVAVRELLEQEFGNYLVGAQAELAARLKSRRSGTFQSACFELLLYGLLTRNGFRLEAHPDPGNGTANRPDFLVTSAEGVSFFLEAVLASEIRDGNAGAEAMKEHVLDELDRDPHPNFYLGVMHSGDPASQPPVKRLKRHVRNWLDTLDPKTIAAAVREFGHGVYPQEHWEHEGWSLELRAMPKNLNLGKMDRLLGVISGRGGWVDLKTPIRNAIRFKGAHYGNLPLPLVCCSKCRRISSA